MLLPIEDYQIRCDVEEVIHSYNIWDGGHCEKEVIDYDNNVMSDLQVSVYWKGDYNFSIYSDDYYVFEECDDLRYDLIRYVQQNSLPNTVDYNHVLDFYNNLMGNLMEDMVNQLIRDTILQKERCDA